MDKKATKGLLPITRRDFLRITGGVSGVCLAFSLSKTKVGNAQAASRPVVVSVHDGDATDWDHASGYHWERIDQNVVSDMVATGVMTLTAKSTLASAWQDLVPYQNGEAVAIKVNFNNSWECQSTNNMDAYPETVNAVIEGLLLIGIPPEKIWITDPSRVIPSRFVDGIRTAGVRFFSAIDCCSNTCSLTDYVSAASSAATPTTYPPGDYVRPAQVFADAAHLINIPLFKGHVAAGVTLGMKNHFGSVTFLGNDPNEARLRMHHYLYPDENPDPTKSVLTDININPHIRNKTRLILGDGLFGNPLDNLQPPQRWAIFANGDPNILFFGIDPVATDSVMCDYINEERIRIGSPAASNSYLQHAQSKGLGIHDQWDDFQSKQYAGIIYLQVEGTSPGFEPRVWTTSATSITTTSAVLNGRVKANDPAGADYFFKFGSTADYDHETEHQHAIGDGDVSVVVGSLQPDAEYHFRIEATTPYGAGQGQDLVFRTPASDPVDPTPKSPGSKSGGGGGCFISASKQ
jgi:hypothetical protein